MITSCQAWLQKNRHGKTTNILVKHFSVLQKLHKLSKLGINPAGLREYNQKQYWRKGLKNDPQFAFAS